MTSTVPYIESYPKTTMLRDETQVVVRPLSGGDKIRLHNFFLRIPEEESYYLKENITSPELIYSWTTNIDFNRVIPIIALAGDEIIADATLHRSRAAARQHIGELRVVVDPAYREVGLGRRLIRELLDIATDLGLKKVFFELVTPQEEAAIVAAGSLGFREVATLKERIRDMWGNYQDLVLMEMSLKEPRPWWF